MSIRDRVLADEELIGTLKERWIAAEVAKQLDYPIFMAVSERGGKDNSGDYKYTLDEQGSLVEFPDGHPQEGQLVIDQDLVNYDLRAADLADAAGISDDQLCVAEAFSYQAVSYTHLDVYKRQVDDREPRRYVGGLSTSLAEVKVSGKRRQSQACRQSTSERPKCREVVFGVQTSRLFNLAQLRGVAHWFVKSQLIQAKRGFNHVPR